MARARILLVCTLAAALAGCRTEAPRQSLKDYAAAKPASVAAPPPAAAPTPVSPPARSEAPPPPAPARAPATAEADTEQPKDQLHASCWERYRDHLAGEKPNSFEEKVSADVQCRLIVCPTCPAEVVE
jgi:hypothetical protein